MTIRVRRLDRQHDMTFGRGLANVAEEEEAVAQRVKTRLYTLKGEWFLDTDAGVPYLQEIATKPVKQAEADAILKTTVLKTEGVEEIVEWASVLDRAQRRLKISCVVRNIYGKIEKIQVDL